MTSDDQIRAAYQRLDSALVPPPDALRRVARRSAVRRRRRRVAVVGTAAVVALTVAGTAARLADEDDRTDTVTVDPSGPVSTLVVTRPDGSTVAFPEVTISCAQGGIDGASNGAETITAISPRRVEGDRLLEPFMYFEGILAKIQGDRTFTLPHNTSQDSDQRPMVLFVADTQGAEGGNEVSSQQNGAAGTVRVLRASCGPEPVLELEVDATLGSEVEQNTLDIEGSLR
jgi:hypothetical protein